MKFKTYNRVEVINTNSSYYGEYGYVSNIKVINNVEQYLICFDNGDKIYFYENDIVEV